MFSGEMLEVTEAKDEVKYYLENLGKTMPRGDKLNKEVHRILTNLVKGVTESDKEEHSGISSSFRFGLIEW